MRDAARQWRCTLPAFESAFLSEREVEEFTLLHGRIGWLQATQQAEALPCAHMIGAKPRWLVPSKLSNPCSSFILGERTGERS